MTVAVVAAGSGCGGGVAGGGSAGSGGSGGNPPGCPSTAPAEGAGCPTVGLSCEYDAGTDGCGQTTTQTATCTKSGTWSISTDYPGTSCNPPPPKQSVCHSVEPTLGSWCDTEPGLVCTYPGSCCSNIYECIGYEWHSVAPPCNPPIPICPEAEPVPGTPCDAPCGVSYNCSYGACGDGGPGMSTAQCTNGTWEVAAVDCG